MHEEETEEQRIKLAEIQKTQRREHSAGWNAGDLEGEDIQLAGMEETDRNRTFSWLECR